jgi:hypothetical protein
MMQTATMVPGGIGPYICLFLCKEQHTWVYQYVYIYNVIFLLSHIHFYLFTCIDKIVKQQMYTAQLTSFDPIVTTYQRLYISA